MLRLVLSFLALISGLVVEARAGSNAVPAPVGVVQMLRVRAAAPTQAGRMAPVVPAPVRLSAAPVLAFAPVLAPRAATVVLKVDRARE